MRYDFVEVLAVILVALPLFARHLPDAEAESDSLRPAQPPHYYLKPVIVTATRVEHPEYLVPYAVDIIEFSEIQGARIGISQGEVLRAIPGVVVNNRHNLSQGDRISIRGLGSRASFGVRGIKILLDGIPLTMPDGQSQLNNLDLGSAERIEILRGPSSSIYGNAAGGAIIIQTDLPPGNDHSIKFLPKIISGDDGLLSIQGKVEGNWKSNAISISGRKMHLDGYREHSASDIFSLNVIGRFNLSKSLKLTALSNYVNSPYLLNPGSLTKEDAQSAPQSARTFIKLQGAGKRVRQLNNGITFHYRDDRSNTLHTTLYGLKRSLLNAIPGRIIELDRSGGGFRTVFSTPMKSGDRTLRWIAGIDYEMQHDTRVEFQNNGIPEDRLDTISAEEIFDLLKFGEKQQDQEETVRSIGPFSRIELSFTPQWILILGIRYDHFHFQVSDRFFEDGIDDSGTRKMSNLSPMIGVAYHPRPLFSVYGNYSTAFQTPTTTELGNRPGREGGFNPSLQPEKIASLELGIKGVWQSAKLDFNLALYTLDISEMLIPYQIQDPNSEEIFYRNAGQARSSGVELNLRWHPWENLRVVFSYTYIRFYFKDYLAEALTNGENSLIQLRDNEIPGVPPQHLFAGIGYRHPFGGYAETDLQWTATYFANDFNGPPPASIKPLDSFRNYGYMVVDFRVGIERPFSRVTVNIFSGVSNIFDQRYSGSIVPNAFGDRFFEPAPGRRWYVGVAIPFSPIRKP